MTSTRFWDFLTPPTHPSLSGKCILFIRKFGVHLDPPLPLLFGVFGRHLWKPPNDRCQNQCQRLLRFATTNSKNLERKRTNERSTNDVRAHCCLFPEKLHFPLLSLVALPACPNVQNGSNRVQFLLSLDISRARDSSFLSKNKISKQGTVQESCLTPTSGQGKHLGHVVLHYI